MPPALAAAAAGVEQRRAGVGVARELGRRGTDGACRSFLGGQDENNRSLADPVAKLDLELVHNAAERRRHFHRGLVGFESEQWLLRL